MRHVTDRPQGIAQQLLQLAAEACQPVLCRGGLRQMRRQPGAGRGAQGDFGGVVVQVLVFVPRIVRAVDQLVLVRAMAGSQGINQPTAGFILGALGTRMADSLREEMEGAGRITAADAEAAMAEVVAAIRAMEAAGDLFLIAAEAEEEGETEIEMATA